jgi:hypothetical protein
MMNGRVSSPEHSLFFDSMALIVQRTVRTAVPAAAFARSFVLYYRTHRKCYNRKKYQYNYYVAYIRT